MNWILVGIGGAIGAISRFGLSKSIPAMDMHAFPWATLWANLLGCFLIGVLYLPASKLNTWMAPFLITGFLGGFTTFSSFGLETVHLLRADKLSLAFTYVGVSTIGGLICVVLGYGMSKLIIA